MPWFKVDDNLAFHQKALRAGNAAMGLWVRAGSWCAQQLSDGFVPADIALTLGTRGEARKLVAANLWLEREGGYEFWQWSEDGRQPTRAEVETKRKEARERQRRAREAREVSQRDNPRDMQRESHGMSQRDSAAAEEASDALPNGFRPRKRSLSDNGNQIVTKSAPEQDADAEHANPRESGAAATSSRSDSSVTDGASHASPDPTRPDPLTTAAPERGIRTETLRPVDATKHPPEPPPGTRPAPRVVDESRCSKHPDGNANEACAGCARVREYRDKAADREAEKRRRELEDARNACTRCDGTWLVDEEGRPTRRKCDHQRRTA